MITFEASRYLPTIKWVVSIGSIAFSTGTKDTGKSCATVELARPRASQIANGIMRATIRDSF